MCESHIEILGMVIYGTELVLWIGVFICGFVFNFLPWAQEHSKKRESAVCEQTEDQHNDHHQDITLHDMPSSTSVFRTASGSDVVARRVRRH